MRIAVVHVTTEQASGAYTDMISANFERAKAPGTKIEHRFVAHLRRATDTVFAYPTLLNQVDVVDCVVDAEADGCDAVMVACSGDPGVAEARTLVSIPVVGAMEAAMLLACSYGDRFGIVTVPDRSWVSYNEQAVRRHGLGERFAGVEGLDRPTAEIFTDGFSDPSTVTAAIRVAAARSIAAGADSVVIGSAGLSVFATLGGLGSVDPPGAPVFDCLTVGLKTAELRADLLRRIGVPAVSRAGWSAAFSPSERARVDRTFGRNRHQPEDTNADPRA